MQLMEVVRDIAVPDRPHSLPGGLKTGLVARPGGCPQQTLLRVGDLGVTI
jgi:hypothetical protein